MALHCLIVAFASHEMLLTLLFKCCAVRAAGCNSRQAWNQKHDSDTSVLGNKLELLRQFREADLVQLKALEDRYKADVQQREDRRKEEARQAELQRIRAQELGRRSEAALTIQCSTRKWLAKQELNNIKNPKKGKKGGGKDKGKKGKK